MTVRELSLPFLAISPYARVNFVDHKITDQTSMIKFIEDNWGLGGIGNQSRIVTTFRYIDSIR